MAIEHQELTYNVTGQSLFIDVPEGQPSSVTSVKVLPWNSGDDDTAESATTGSASIDSVSTVFDAISGPSAANQRTVSIASTTGIEIGRQYLATSTTGESEWIEVVGIDSGSKCTARFPLLNDFPSSSTFVGTRVTISVADAWIQDDGTISGGGSSGANPGYRVRWVYVVGGVSYVRYTYASVVRAAGKHNVFPTDVERLVPGFIVSLPTYHRDDQGRGLIDEAYEQVRIDLLQENQSAAEARNQDVIDELVKRKTVVLWAESRYYAGANDTDQLDQARMSYSSRFDQLIRVPSQAKIPFASDSGGGGSVVQSTRLTIR